MNLLPFIRMSYWTFLLHMWSSCLLAQLTHNESRQLSRLIARDPMTTGRRTSLLGSFLETPSSSIPLSQLTDSAERRRMILLEHPRVPRRPLEQAYIDLTLERDAAIEPFEHWRNTLLDVFATQRQLLDPAQPRGFWQRGFLRRRNLFAELKRRVKAEINAEGNVRRRMDAVRALETQLRNARNTAAREEQLGEHDPILTSYREGKRDLRTAQRELHDHVAEALRAAWGARNTLDAPGQGLLQALRSKERWDRNWIQQQMNTRYPEVILGLERNSFPMIRFQRVRVTQIGMHTFSARPSDRSGRWRNLGDHSSDTSTRSPVRRSIGSEA